MPPKGFSKSDLVELIGFYLVSNTPNYLYKKFISNDHVQWLSAFYSSRELIDFYKRFDSSDIENIVGGYAALIALILKDFEEANQAINVLELSKLDWGQEIKNIFYFSKRQPRIYSKDANFKISSTTDIGNNVGVNYFEESGTKIKEL